MSLIEKCSGLPAIAMALSISLVAFSTAAGQANPDWPDWLNKAVAKETKKLKSKKIKLGQSGIEALMPGKKQSEPVEYDDYWYLSSSIGGDSPLECYVYLTNVDLAGSAKSIAALQMEEVAQANNNGEVGTREITVIDAGAIEDESRRKELMVIVMEDLAPQGLTGSDLNEGGKAARRWPEIEQKHLDKIRNTMHLRPTDS